MSPTATTSTVVIARRHNGPPETANGGYACGLVARHVDGPAHVSLRRPVPLATPLELERHDDGHVTLHDGDALIAEADPALPLDGLGVIFGPLRERPDMTGAVLHAGAAETLAPEVVWAALDCPSYTPSLWRNETPSLLASMRAEILAPVPAGKSLVVAGWTLGSDRRKHRSATAILAPEGRVLARAEALWIRLRS